MAVLKDTQARNLLPESKAVAHGAVKGFVDLPSSAQHQTYLFAILSTQNSNKKQHPPLPSFVKNNI